MWVGRVVRMGMHVMAEAGLGNAGWRDADGSCSSMLAAVPRTWNFQ